MKPLGIKSYGSIPHLIGSRVGPSDHHAHEGQVRICTEKVRDKNDIVIVQEKLDGGNVGVCKINGEILAITRAGYLAETSPYKTHHAFKEWVKRNEGRFNCLLWEGERVCGEWILTSVGTKYKLNHEPFVPFDLIMGKDRANFNEFTQRINAFDFTPPKLLSIGNPVSIALALDLLEVSGHGALEATEGAVWRVERKGKVDFLCKYVRPEKVDGKYLEDSPANELPPRIRLFAELLMKLCLTTNCGNHTQNANMDFCASCATRHRKTAKQRQKESEKRERQKQISLQTSADTRAVYRQAKIKKVSLSRNPKDWKNKMYCSDGTRVGQKEINERLRRSYSISNQGVVCEGCGTGATNHAHIIAQARCKQIGKTELIWNPENYFPACNRCNSAIENPKGIEWRSLRNIEKCLSFIKQHDPELFAKFEYSQTPII